MSVEKHGLVKCLFDRLCTCCWLSRAYANYCTLNFRPFFEHPTSVDLKIHKILHSNPPTFVEFCIGSLKNTWRNFRFAQTHAINIIEISVQLKYIDYLVVWECPIYLCFLLVMWLRRVGAWLKKVIHLGDYQSIVIAYKLRGVKLFVAGLLSWLLFFVDVNERKIISG